MGTGIQVCGLNGCGKSTLGKALAERMGFRFIDNETLYFSETYANETYMKPKSRKDVEKLLIEEIKKYPDFVFVAVKGDYGIEEFYNYIVMIEVPRDVRLQRVRNRSFQKFGNRMLSGGDLYEQEEQFFRTVEARRDSFTEDWLKSVECPVIRVDGTKTIEENVEYIIERINV